MEVNERHVEYNSSNIKTEYIPLSAKLTVFLEWDQEAEVWIATSDDVPGLVLESPSCDALMKRVRQTVPELLELNINQ